jgi:thioredoxin-related protein
MLMNVSKKIELAANVAIIAVACLLAIVLIKNHLFTGARANEPANTKQSSNQPVLSENQIGKGTHLSSLDVDWKQSKQTLVLAISNTCHFCTDSAPFYQALVKAKKDARVVAVLPQPVEEGRAYLEKLGVSVDEIRQLPLDKIGVRGTPTLILVDTSGTVKDLWVGRLPPEKETDVMNRLQF